MQSAVLRLDKNRFLSSVDAIPAEIPSFEVEPSLATTREATTLMHVILILRKLG